MLRSSLAGKQAFLLRVPQSYSPDRSSDVIVEQVDKVLAVAGVEAAGGSANGHAHHASQMFELATAAAAR